jgi:hypothetical protein
MTIKCGNHDSRTKHNNAEQVRMCYAGAGVVSSELIVTPRETYTLSVVAFPEDYDDGAAWAEQAYERYLEDQGSDEARLQDQIEAERGVISFSDAWDLADPSRVTQREADERGELHRNRFAASTREQTGFIGGNKQSPRGSSCSGRPAVRELEDAIYRNPTTGEIFKVYHTVHGANVQVAKRLVLLDEPFTKIVRGKEVQIKAEFIYEGKKGLKGLTPEMRMTLEQAKEFGAVYGVCVRCAATLTKEESIERAMGSTCASKI